MEEAEVAIKQVFAGLERGYLCGAERCGHQVYDLNAPEKYLNGMNGMEE